MPDVIFDEPKISQRERMEMRETSGFANLLIRVGIAKTERGAIFILLGFTVVAIIVSALLFFGGGGNKPNKIPQFREDISEEVKAKLPPGVLETIPSKFQK